MNNENGMSTKQGIVILVVLVAATTGFSLMFFGKQDISGIQNAQELPLREALWNVRALDLIVQSSIIFAGVLGILALFRPEMVPEIEAEAETTKTVTRAEVEDRAEDEFFGEEEEEAEEEEIEEEEIEEDASEEDEDETEDETREA